MARTKPSQPGARFGGPWSTATPPRAYLELWLALSRTKWGSLVIIPAAPQDSSAPLAKAVADIGQRLSYSPVTAINISSLEFGTALALVDLQQHIDRTPQTIPTEPPVPVEATSPSPSPGAPEAGPQPAADPAPADPTTDASETTALTVIPPARVIISIPSVIEEPLGLSVTRESDLVVLMARVGHTRLADIRKTVQLIGRERLAGCFLER